MFTSGPVLRGDFQPIWGFGPRKSNTAEKEWKIAFEVCEHSVNVKQDLSMRFPAQNECLYLPTKSTGANSRSGALQPPHSMPPPSAPVA